MEERVAKVVLVDSTADRNVLYVAGLASPRCCGWRGHVGIYHFTVLRVVGGGTGYIDLQNLPYARLQYRL